MGFTYIGVFLLEALLLFVGPFALPLDNLVSSDAVYALVLLAHLAVGVAVLRMSRRADRRVDGFFLRTPEILFVVCLLFFLFSYIYALNANMDYVQRFIRSGGAVRLAIDTRQERWTAAARYLPLLAVNQLFYVYYRIRRGSAAAPWREPAQPEHPPASGPELARRWSLLLVLISVGLGTLAFPSFVRLQGFGFLAYVALVPLFLVLLSTPIRWGLLYGTAFGVLQGMLLNYWLGTFSLVTLQLVSLVTLAYHVPFLLAVLWLIRRLPRLGVLTLAAGWTVFEYLRSLGFLGYPWGLWGTTQVEFLPLIQVASLTGVWGVSFVVLLMNAGIAAALATILGGGRALARRPAGWAPLYRREAMARRERGLPGRWEEVARRVPGLLGAAALFVVVLLFGAISLGVRQSLPLRKTARLALVQQNDDPRKHDYQDTFRTLVRLTDEAMLRHPDLVVWSETAFVPNIRRWSAMDPQEYPLAALVRQFLEYQRALRVWLLTGNDDYELRVDDQGQETRLDYNASILFDPQGERVQTYHKMHLVPFTEYFPWKEQLPGVYDWLKNRDVYLWEPGKERTVFRHPKFSFSTPICFEDSFPGDVRQFVTAGAEAIINLSNDYWSLTEVEGRQHAANSAFRAVENRRPLVRATASGLTCYVDPEGRFRAALPYYVEGVLVVDVEFVAGGQRLSVYSRLGDWFPLCLLGLLGALAVLASARLRRPPAKEKPRKRGPRT